jgi:signal transduction histidine kinase
VSGIRTSALADTRGDMAKALTRQSVLVASVCLVADSFTFLNEGADSVYPGLWRWAVLAAIILVDAALASPARMSGAVGIAQAAVAVACAALTPTGSPLPDGNDAGVLIAAYRAGAWLKGIPAALTLACLVAGLVGVDLLGGEDLTQWWTLILTAVTKALLPWLVGRNTTARRAYIAELEQQSERERHEARQAVADAIVQERSAIARDLHDVIAHHVSAIGVHAGAARLGLTSSHSTSRLTRALTAVETSSRAAMLDLRRLLDFLHGGPSEGVRQPGLDNLDELLDAVHAAGLRTRITTHGRPQTLPDSLDIAVYRVLQEVLTNALRHGRGLVHVELLYDREWMTVTARNPVPVGRPPVPESQHRGLEGIRSRAEMFSGVAVYGPTPDGGDWSITATFSLDRT